MFVYDRKALAVKRSYVTHPHPPHLTCFFDNALSGRSATTAADRIGDLQGRSCGNTLSKVGERFPVPGFAGLQTLRWRGLVSSARRWALVSASPTSLWPRRRCRVTMIEFV